jgi:hypothetical protein
VQVLSTEIASVEEVDFCLLIEVVDANKKRKQSQKKYCNPMQVTTFAFRLIPNCDDTSF